MKRLIYLIVIGSLTLTSSCNKDETCSDGIQNGDETGIDCGGSCSPCSTSTPTPTPTAAECTDEVLLDMYGKMYGQIADTSSLNGNTSWPYPYLVQYFKITDSTSAETITTPCKGGGYTWDNLDRRLFYYFQRYEVNGTGEIYANGNVEFKLGSHDGDFIYGVNCSLSVPIYTYDAYCPLFFMDEINSESEHIMSSGTISNDLQFINYSDSVYIIDIHRDNMEEYTRDTAVYYLIN